MVLEVDEARVLEAFEDGVGSLLLRVGFARQEGREIDELGIIKYGPMFLAEYKVPESPNRLVRLLSLP
jgi:hypothetical protein